MAKVWRIGPCLDPGFHVENPVAFAHARGRFQKDGLNLCSTDRNSKRPIRAPAHHGYRLMSRRIRVNECSKRCSRANGICRTGNQTCHGELRSIASCLHNSGIFAASPANDFARWRGRGSSTQEDLRALQAPCILLNQTWSSYLPSRTSGAHRTAPRQSSLSGVCRTPDNCSTMSAALNVLPSSSGAGFGRVAPHRCIPCTSPAAPRAGTL